MNTLLFNIILFSTIQKFYPSVKPLHYMVAMYLFKTIFRKIKEIYENRNSQIEGMTGMTDMKSVKCKCTHSKIAKGINNFIKSSTTLPLCKAIKKYPHVNFNYYAIRELKKNDSTKRDLENINNELLKVTGKKTITHKDLLSCVKGYNCINTHCNIDNIITSMNKLFEPQTAQKALAVFRKQIIKYQSLSKNMWQKELDTIKTNSPKGLKFTSKGQIYYIPWSIFYKHFVCFPH